MFPSPALVQPVRPPKCKTTSRIFITAYGHPVEVVQLTRVSGMSLSALDRTFKRRPRTFALRIRIKPNLTKPCFWYIADYLTRLLQYYTKKAF